MLRTSVESAGFLRRSRDYVLLTFNLAGAILYDYRASPSWAIPQEKGLHSQTAEPFIWALSVFPIIALFFVINLIWGGFIIFRRQWRSGNLWLLTALIWLIAAMIDFARH